MSRELFYEKPKIILHPLSLLQRCSNTTQQKFLENVERQLVVARLLPLIIEVAIDINNHSRNESSADTYLNSFIQLGN